MMARISALDKILSSRAFSTFRILPRSGKNRLEMAVAPLLGGAAGGVPFDDVQFADGRVPGRTVGQLAGQRTHFQRVLAAGQLPRLARRLARPGRLHDFSTMLARHGRILVQKLRELLGKQRFDDAAHFAVAEFRLRLPFELRFRNLDGDDRRQPFPHVVAGQVGLVVLQQACSCARNR